MNPRIRWPLFCWPLFACVACGSDSWVSVSVPTRASLPGQAADTRIYEANPGVVDSRDLALTLAYLQLGSTATPAQWIERANQLLEGGDPITGPLDPVLTTTRLDYALPAGVVDNYDLAVILASIQLGSAAGLDSLAAQVRALLGVSTQAFLPSDIRQIPGQGLPTDPSVVEVSATLDHTLIREVGTGTLNPKAGDIEVEVLYPDDMEKPTQISVSGLPFTQTQSDGNSIRYGSASAESDLPKGSLLQVAIQSQQPRSREQSRSSFTLQSRILSPSDGIVLGTAESRPVPGATPTPSPTASPSVLDVSGSYNATYQVTLGPTVQASIVVEQTGSAITGGSVLNQGSSQPYPITSGTVSSTDTTTTVEVNGTGSVQCPGIFSVTFTLEVPLLAGVVPLNTPLNPTVSSFTNTDCGGNYAGTVTQLTRIQ